MSFQVGDRVQVKTGNLGYVRYFDGVEFAEGIWVGVELDEANGKNDGVVKGVRYFTCPPSRGLFVRPALLTKVNQEPVATTAEDCSHIPLESPESSKNPLPVKRQSKQSPPKAKAVSKKPFVPAEDVEVLRSELANAMEEHDLGKLSELLPKAVRCGNLPPQEIDTAQRIYNYGLRNERNSLKVEVDDAVNAISQIIDKLDDLDDRVSDLELHEMLRLDKGQQPGAVGRLSKNAGDKHESGRKISDFDNEHESGQMNNYYGNEHESEQTNTDRDDKHETRQGEIEDGKKHGHSEREREDGDKKDVSHMTTDAGVEPQRQAHCVGDSVDDDGIADDVDTTDNDTTTTPFLRNTSVSDTPRIGRVVSLAETVSQRLNARQKSNGAPGRLEDLGHLAELRKDIASSRWQGLSVLQSKLASSVSETTEKLRAHIDKSVRHVISIEMQNFDQRFSEDVEKIKHHLEASIDSSISSEVRKQLSQLQLPANSFTEHAVFSPDENCGCWLAEGVDVHLRQPGTSRCNNQAQGAWGAEPFAKNQTRTVPMDDDVAKHLVGGRGSPSSRLWRSAIRKVLFMRRAGGLFSNTGRGSFSAGRVVGELEATLAIEEEYEAVLSRWGQRRRTATVSGAEQLGVGCAAASSEGLALLERERAPRVSRMELCAAAIAQALESMQLAQNCAARRVGQACIPVQKWMRGYLVRKRIRQISAEEIHCDFKRAQIANEDFIVTCKKDMAEAIQRAELEVASQLERPTILIQAGLRGGLVRQNLQQYLKEREACQVLYDDMKKTRQSMIAAKACAQSTARSGTAACAGQTGIEKAEEPPVVAASIIQAHARGLKARQKYKETLTSVISIQAAMRGFIVRKLKCRRTHESSGPMRSFLKKAQVSFEEPPQAPGRKFTQAEKHAEGNLRSKFILRIQAWWRGAKVRRRLAAGTFEVGSRFSVARDSAKLDLDRIRASKERMAAAERNAAARVTMLVIRIQAKVRAFLARIRVYRIRNVRRVCLAQLVHIRSTHASMKEARKLAAKGLCLSKDLFHARLQLDCMRQTHKKMLHDRHLTERKWGCNRAETDVQTVMSDIRASQERLARAIRRAEQKVKASVLIQACSRGMIARKRARMKKQAIGNLECF